MRLSGTPRRSRTVAPRPLASAPHPGWRRLRPPEAPRRRRGPPRTPPVPAEAPADAAGSRRDPRETAVWCESRCSLLVYVSSRVRPAPFQGVFEPVVAPEDLIPDDERGGTEDAHAAGQTCFGVEPVPYLGG